MKKLILAGVAALVLLSGSAMAHGGGATIRHDHHGFEWQLHLPFWGWHHDHFPRYGRHHHRHYKPHRHHRHGHQHDHRHGGRHERGHSHGHGDRHNGGRHR